MSKNHTNRHRPPNNWSPTPMPAEVVVLLLRTDDDITIGGAYASQQDAQAAEDRVPWPHLYQCVRLRVGADLFPSIAQVRITPVPDTDATAPQS